MDLFDRISAFKNIIKIKKIAQTVDFKSLTQNLPQPNLNPEKVSASDRIKQAFSLVPRLETRDPQALQNQLVALANEVRQAFSSLQSVLNTPEGDEEMQKATITLANHMKQNPVLLNPAYLEILSQNVGSFDYFAPFKTQAPNSRQPNAPNPPIQQPKFDANLATGDVRRAEKNAREYIHAINNTPGESGKKFYAQRLTNYVLSPMIMLHNKAAASNNQAISKQIESLFGTIDQQLLDQNPDLLEPELASQVSQIAVRSYA